MKIIEKFSRISEKFEKKLVKTVAKPPSSKNFITSYKIYFIPTIVWKIARKIAEKMSKLLAYSKTIFLMNEVVGLTLPDFLLKISNGLKLI